jgi:itaconate CoA-transferase
VRLAGVEPVMDPIPALGQHSAAILAELGFDADTIARWQRERVI